MPTTQAISGGTVKGLVCDAVITNGSYGHSTAQGPVVSRVRLDSSFRGCDLAVQSTTSLYQGHRCGQSASRMRVTCELEARGSDSRSEASLAPGPFAQRLTSLPDASQISRMPAAQATSAPALPVSAKPEVPPSAALPARDSRSAGLSVVDPFAVGPLDLETPRYVSDEAIQAELEIKQRLSGVTFEGAGRDPPTSSKPATLVLMRHGESMWNDLKLFTGDVDIPLTEKGALEAMEGGKAVSTIDFDMIFTSRLIRSKQTALLAMTQSKHKRVPVIVRGGFMGKGKTGDDNRLRLREAAWHALQKAECRMIPVYADPALNERCYGHLQGLNKDLAVKEFGKDTVDRWRRSHNTSPPGGESLLDTWDRCVSFFQGTIEPRLQEGNSVLVVAHGNVLRCIIAYLAGLSTLEMLRLQIVTALPYAYSYDGERFAACCVLPPVDPTTNKPRKGLPQGLASVLKEEIDSLI